MLDTTPPKPALDALEANGIAARAGTWCHMRGGRTNRVWRFETPVGPLVCKMFGRSGDNPLYPNLPRTEFEILQALSGRNIAPMPVLFIEAEADIGDILVYRFLEGQNWRHGVQDVARLLAKIHAQTAAVNLRHVPSGSASHLRQTQRILGQCRNVMADVRPPDCDAEIAPISSPVLIHTDVVPDNIVATTHGLRLIDWQCPGIGDPCEDIASFLSPAMQHLYGASPLSGEQIAAFLAAYGQPEITRRYRRLAPLFHWRAAAYCLWKSEQGCVDYKTAQALELSALQKTRRQYYEAGQYDTDTDIA